MHATPWGCGFCRTRVCMVVLQRSIFPETGRLSILNKAFSERSGGREPSKNTRFDLSTLALVEKAINMIALKNDRTTAVRSQTRGWLYLENKFMQYMPEESTGMYSSSKNPARISRQYFRATFFFLTPTVLFSDDGLLFFFRQSYWFKPLTFHSSSTELYG